MDIQLILVGVLGIAAVYVLIKKVRKTFDKDELCDQGCGCAVTEIRKARQEK